LKISRLIVLLLIDHVPQFLKPLEYYLKFSAMKKDEVPQDNGLMDGKFRDLCYALDENGKYVQVLSVGWEPKNIAMIQAWEVIKEQISEVRKQVKSGELSPLAFHMEKNLMDLHLLSEYSGFSKSTVKKHLTPEGFKKLKPKELEKYTAAFNITLDQLLKAE
jgi:hypothetical protein